MFGKSVSKFIYYWSSNLMTPFQYPSNYDRTLTMYFFEGKGLGGDVS